MKPHLDPIEQTTCMKCRAATARYYGRWAAEGLCRRCVQAMPAEIRLKVLRDMNPADRKRWQLDGLFSGGPQALGGLPSPAGEPAERKLSRRIEAGEDGSESALREAAERIGAKGVAGAKRFEQT